MLSISTLEHKMRTLICRTSFLDRARGQFILSIFLILFTSACVDRINIDVGIKPFYSVPVVIDGYISDQPGPYLIKVSSAYDIQSKVSTKRDLSVKQLIISDNHGTAEVLTELVPGFYITNLNGIRGVVGRVYTLHIELLDGRVYESAPDTLYATGKVDSIYFKFRLDVTDQYIPGAGSVKYGFDVFFNASAGAIKNYHFLWKFIGTYKVNIACCACWVQLTNSEPIVSDNQLVNDGRFIALKADYVPVTGYTFMYKVHAEVDQMSLSRQSYDFWRAVRAQKQATGSLFQPITGKIPSNFTQISGPASTLQGIFYATSISSNAVYITQKDLPNINLIPKLQLAPGSAINNPNIRCQDLFPNSTKVKPSWWVD